MLLPLPVYEAAYGGNSLWAMAGAHRVSASCAQDGLVPAAKQSNLESVKYFCVVRCGKGSAHSADQYSPERAYSGIYAFHNGEAIAVG
jgi:hypothetical protein